MKKFIFGAMMLAAFAGTYACGSTKKPAKSPSGMVEDIIPLSGPQYRSDANYFRAVQNGASPDRSIAQKLAMQNCRQELAAGIQAELEQVIENYANQQTTESKTSVESQYQELAYTVVKQKMNNVQVVDEKIYKEENGSFRYYVCLQMPKDEIEKAIEDAIINNEKLNLEFDRERFKEIFNAKLGK